MWTPRRLLLLLFGFAVCFGAYEVYSYFLGQYDGLPPLPVEYRSSAQATPPDTADTFPDRKHEIEKLLELAFGAKCQEIYRNRTVEIGKPENRTVLAFDEWNLDEGVLKLSKVSMANYKTIPARDQQPERQEIVTVQGETAYIRFDPPIKNLWEMKQNVKPVAGHIEGEDIKLTHNHGTPDKRDDVTVYCKKRVDFVDEQHRIWSDGKVLVVYAEPQEARFEGVGLEITLVSELLSKQPARKGQAKPAGPKPPGPSLSSVKAVRLDHDVEFNFVKLQGSFLGGAHRPPAQPPAGGVEAPQQPMVIRCKDAFIWNAAANTATFHTRVNGLRYRTVMTPQGPRQQYDEIDTDDKLVLVLEPPKEGEKDKKSTPANPEDEAKQYQLRRAIATGKRVKLTANDDNAGGGLHAQGVEMICDNEKHEATLRGDPQVVARVRSGDKDYDVITTGTVKLLLPEGTEADKDPRGLIVTGPGEIRTRATAEHPDPFPVATWQRELQWHRNPDEQRVELLGSAIFMHEKHGRLAGDSVKVWLTPAAKTDPAALNEKRSTLTEGRMDAKLKRVELDKRVSILSPKLVVQQADRLHLTFTEAPSGFTPQPRSNRGETWSPGPPASPPPGPPGLPGPPATPESPPLYLEASDIDGDIYIVNDRQQIVHRLEARDRVHVERKPDPGKLNGLDIRGQRLEMTLQGNTDLYRIRLFGDIASLQSDKFGLEGKQIDLDQAENRVTVPGAGKFRFLTDRDFQGNPLQGGPQNVLIYWDDKMEFGGRVANFQGGVLAEKAEFTVRCHAMTVTLDRTLTFASRGEDDLQKQTVGIESAICVSEPITRPEQRVIPVVIEQRIKPDQADRQIIRIEGVQAVFDSSKKNFEFIKVYGPGEVNMVRAGKMQLGPPGALPGSPATAPAADPGQLKLTRVLFEGEMEYRKNDGKLRFWRTVKFFHVPGDDVTTQLNPKKLPRDGLYLEADQLEVAAISGENHTVLHEATAEGNILVQLNPTSNIKCDVVYYTEQKGQVIMTGRNGNDALLYHQERPGASQRVQRAKEFKYHQKTGELEVNGAKSLQVR